MLIASTRPYLPSESGRGRTVGRPPADKRPARPPSVTGVKSMHASTRGTYRIFVSGLYDPGSQLLAPSTCGQTMCAWPSPGSVCGLIVFLPVEGSIEVTMFCRPRSFEKTYLP